MEDQTRPSVPALDAILGKTFKVLDDGFVRVIDYMGSDQAVVQAARVSYGAGTKKLSEDTGLIRYLLRHKHSTPFEMCEIKLHVRVPMDCWRQWIRHRTASVNEYSTRYSVAIDAFQTTAPGEWRTQAANNKQGSGALFEEAEGTKITEREQALHQTLRAVYQQRLEQGVAREQARKDLPLSTYTEAYWKIDLHNLLHFLALRMDAHAQWEIRQYAETIGSAIVKPWCPITWAAFEDYRQHAMQFSKMEAELMRALVAKQPDEAVRMARASGFLREKQGKEEKSRELLEFEKKLQSLGLIWPS